MKSQRPANPISTLNEPRKSRRRQGVRRLAEVNTNVNNNDHTKLLKSSIIIALLVGSTVAAISVFLWIENWNTMREFISSYRKQYKEIISGTPNYCDQYLHTRLLFLRMRQHQILHQQQALMRLEVALRNDSSFVGIAFVGPSGVGKSLTAYALAQHFPWRENVHTYAWNTYVRNESEKFAAVQMMADQMSDCGQNLLVIDNLTPKDHYSVTCLNKLLIAATDQAKAPKKLIVLYIFNLNSFEATEQHKMQLLELQHLPDTNTINFQSFGIKELRDCIKREAIQENRTLTADYIEEIVSSINPECSGCKLAHAKLMLYAKSDSI